jgi:hypothetical protein
VPSSAHRQCTSAPDRPGTDTGAARWSRRPRPPRPTSVVVGQAASGTNRRAARACSRGCQARNAARARSVPAGRLGEMRVDGRPGRLWLVFGADGSLGARPARQRTRPTIAKKRSAPCSPLLRIIVIVLLGNPSSGEPAGCRTCPRSGATSGRTCHRQRLHPAAPHDLLQRQRDQPGAGRAADLSRCQRGDPRRAQLAPLRAPVPADVTEARPPAKTTATAVARTPQLSHEKRVRSRPSLPHHMDHPAADDAPQAQPKLSGYPGRLRAPLRDAEPQGAGRDRSG